MAKLACVLGGDRDGHVPVSARKRFRVVRDSSVDVLSFIRPRRVVDFSWAELVEAFRAHEHKGVRTLSGLRTLDDVLDNHLLPAFGGLRVSEVGVEHVLALIDALEYQGFAPSSIRVAVSTCSSVFEWAASPNGEHAAITNPVRLLPRDALPPARARDPHRARLEVLELEQILRVCYAPEIPFERRLLWRTLLFTGARIGEASAATYGDFRSDVGPLFGELRIERSWDCKAHVVQPTKTGEPRLVPVMRQLARTIDHEARAWFRARWRRDETTHDVICRYLPPRAGGAHRFWAEKTALRWWHKDLLRVGIAHPSSGPRRLHATRHTFVSQCLRLGAQERALEPVTHSPRSSRAERSSAFALYAHLDWPATCRAVALLQDALEKAR